MHKSFAELYNASMAQFYGVPSILKHGPVETSKEDKAEMRKWAKKGKKALLAELLRLQKQCHSNYERYEQEKERSTRNERSHNTTIAQLNGKLEGTLAAIAAFRGEKKENNYE